MEDELAEQWEGMPPEVLGKVTDLFAGLGYDGVTMDLIHSAGVDPATVAALGGKAGLYRRVMEALFHRRQAVLRAAIEEATQDRAGMHQIVDTYLTHCLAHPEELALWAHRWLDDAADLVDLERRYFAPIYEMLEEGTGAVPSRVETHLAITTVGWCIQGFFGQGLVQADGYRRGPRDPGALREFRAHLHHLIDMMLTAPDP